MAAVLLPEGKNIPYTKKATINCQAISLPNFGSRNGPTELEQGRVSDALVEALKAKGHNVRVMEQTSGLQGIMRVNIHGEELWFGGADPRREGVVTGD
jgi:gamma-glutamyltranspeptidase/glutathione hydrolase